MLKTETVTYNGRKYVRTWSDENRMIERDDIVYEEAIDPAELGRTYTETDYPITDVTEAGETDYLAALERLGVK